MGGHLRGAFGGVFGGGIAAATLVAARTVAGGRRPISLHCSFLRTLSTETQRATAVTVSEGRTATTVAVDLHDAEGRPAGRATATFAADAALHEFDAAGPLAAPEVKAFDDGWELPVPKGVDAPLMTTLPLRITGMPAGGFAHAIRAPWAGAGDGAEAAAMMGDYCAGVPVGAAVGREGTRIPVPNPDLSLRFCGDAWGEVIVGVGRLARIDRGAAATLVEVWAGPDDAWDAGDDRPTLLAVGLSSAVMLRQA
jgi:hypothetical protein